MHVYQGFETVFENVILKNLFHLEFLYIFLCAEKKNSFSIFVKSQ